jgi:integrase
MTSCSKTLRHKRDRAILAILLGCELRCAEAVSIRMEHLASSLSPTSRVATKQRLLLRNPGLFSFSRVKVFVQPGGVEGP